MPSSIEILEPDKMIMKTGDLSDLFNDLQGKLHHVDMLTQKLHKDNQKYAQSMLAVTKNIIMLTLSTGAKKIDALVKTSGIEKKSLTIFLEKLIKENHLELNDELYSIKKRNPNAQQIAQDNDANKKEDN